MRLERSLGQHSPEVSPFLIREPIRLTTEFKPFVPSAEVILFSKIDKKKDIETPDQAPEINQTDDLVPAPVNVDWEPFSKDSEPDQKFINLYGGNYYQDMELNRKRAEQLIRVSALQGVVTLQSLSTSRRRGIDINPDGSVTSKKKLF